MLSKFIEITREPVRKGAWYRKGERYLVVPHPHYPMLNECEYLAHQGPIPRRDCTELKGPRALFLRLREKARELRDDFRRRTSPTAD
jgi:hypothetical protein